MKSRRRVNSNVGRLQSLWRNKMDDAALNQLLDTSGRQFWIKSWGHETQASHPSAHVRSEFFGAPKIEVAFAKNPARLMLSDILIIYHIILNQIKSPTLTCVTEVVSHVTKATPSEMAREPWRERWSWSVQSNNLTPDFGSRYFDYPLNPYSIADDYNELHPHDQIKLGTLQHGAPLCGVSEGFAQFI